MKDEDSEKVPSIAPFVLFVAFITIACVFFGIITYSCIDTWEHRGQFGDMFGALNALFSGAAFAGVVYAIILQRRELAMQREEMQLSRKELAAQNQLITAQLATMQDSLRFERIKEDLSSEPLFKLGNENSSVNSRTFTLSNLGGRITHITMQTLAPKEGIRTRLSQSEILDTNGNTMLVVEGFGCNPCPDCEFEMSYTDKLNRPQKKRYRLLDKKKLEELPCNAPL